MSRVNCEEMRGERNDVLDEFDFQRKLYFRPTEAWERTWRRNLARAPRRHTAEESLSIRHAVWDWREQDPNTRLLQKTLAASLRVSKQYVNHLVHTLPPRQTLPPVTHRDFRQPDSRELTAQRPVPPSYDPHAHGWNCNCAGCRIKAQIDAVIRKAADDATR